MHINHYELYNSLSWSSQSTDADAPSPHNSNRKELNTGPNELCFNTFTTELTNFSERSQSEFQKESEDGFADCTPQSLGSRPSSSIFELDSPSHHESCEVYQDMYGPSEGCEEEAESPVRPNAIQQALADSREAATNHESQSDSQYQLGLVGHHSSGVFTLGDIHEACLLSYYAEEISHSVSDA